MKTVLLCIACLFFGSLKAQRQGGNNPKNANAQQNAYYWMYKGYTAVENGNYQEAITNYTKAINLDSSFSEAYRYRGIAKCYAKNYYEAIPDFDSAIKLDPEDAASYNSRGAVYEELHILKVAIKDYAKAVELAPHNKRYKENLSDAQDIEAAK
jgi:tetratricopeptide (TPR) repeat protein